LAIVQEPEHSIHLTVKDNGKGCLADELTKGFGILGMKERIHSLGGKLSIHGHLNKGLEVNVLIPLIGSHSGVT
jgi:two-component system, NarL family, sensor histidine kinase UhpB